MRWPSPAFFLRVADFFRSRYRTPFFYLVLACFGFQLTLTILQCHNLVDDAYISARYARNLAQGFGLVYNRGPGVERVEGYSNFLWVLVLALGWETGLSMRFTAQFLGAGFAILTSVILFLWVRQSTGKNWAGLCAAGLAGSNIYFAVWNVQGLETPLFSLLLIAGLYALSLGRQRLAIFLALLAALTRPDGALLFLSMAVIEFWELRKNFPALLKSAASWLYFLIPYAVYFLWRAIYYHSLLPNTFYAKTGLGLTGMREAAIYFAGLALKDQGILLFLAAVVFGLVSSKKSERSLLTGAFFLPMYYLFIFIAGGDWMPDFRLLVPTFPLIYGLGMTLLNLPSGREKSPARNRAAAVLAGIALAANLFHAGKYMVFKSYEKTWHQRQASFYRPTADWLKRHVWQSQVIAAGDIGYIGYFGDHDRIIDTMGLVDRRLGRVPGIASLNTDLDYIFEQNPFAIVRLVHRYPDGTELGHNEFDRKVFLDQRFNKNYHLVKEIFAWQNQEISRTDWQKRTSYVYFKIYIKNNQ
jgi:hypothetical protein